MLAAWANNLFYHAVTYNWFRDTGSLADSLKLPSP